LNHHGIAQSRITFAQSRITFAESRITFVTNPSTSRITMPKGEASRSLFDAVALMTGLMPLVRKLEARLAADVEFKGVAEDFTFAAASVMGDDVTGLGFPTCDAVDALTFSRLGH
jgi:hypothetical protein